jgi:hypothetical protein
MQLYLQFIFYLTLEVESWKIKISKCFGHIQQFKICRKPERTELVTHNTEADSSITHMSNK